MPTGENCNKDEKNSSVYVCKPLEECSTLMRPIMLYLSKPDHSVSCAPIDDKPAVCCPLHKKSTNDIILKKQMHHNPQEHDQMHAAIPKFYYSASESMQNIYSINLLACL